MVDCIQKEVDASLLKGRFSSSRRDCGLAMCLSIHEEEAAVEELSNDLDVTEGSLHVLASKEKVNYGYS